MIFVLLLYSFPITLQIYRSWTQLLYRSPPSRNQSHVNMTLACCFFGSTVHQQPGHWHVIRKSDWISKSWRSWREEIEGAKHGLLHSTINCPLAVRSGVITPISIYKISIIVWLQPQLSIYKAIHRAPQIPHLVPGKGPVGPPCRSLTRCWSWAWPKRIALDTVGTRFGELSN